MNTQDLGRLEESLSLVLRDLTFFRLEKNQKEIDLCLDDLRQLKSRFEALAEKADGLAFDCDQALKQEVAA